MIISIINTYFASSLPPPLPAGPAAIAAPAATSELAKYCGFLFQS